MKNKKGVLKVKQHTEAGKIELQSILDNLHDLVSLTDLQGNYLFAGASHQVLGYEIEDLIGKNVMDFVHPDDLPGVQAKFADFMTSQKERADTIYRNRCADGSYLWFETIGTILRDKKGNPERILFNTRNITERKQAEEALRESEATIRNKLNAILEPEGDIETLSLADIIDVSELQEMMEDFHKTSQIGGAILDISGNVLVGVAWSDICAKFHRAHPSTAKNCLESDLALSKGVPFGEFKAYRCKNNMWDMVCPIEVGGKHLGNIFIGQFFYDDEHVDYDVFKKQAKQYNFNEKEYLAALDRVPRLKRETVASAMSFYTKLAKMISTLSFSKIKLSRDIAQRKQAEMRLRESEERFQKMLALIPDMISIHDKNFNIVYSNWKGFAAVDDEKRRLRTKCYKTYRDIDEICPDCRAKEVLRTKKTFRSEAELPDGTWVDLRVIPVLDKNDELELFVEWVRDITEQKQNEKTKQVFYQVANEMVFNFDLNALIKAAEKQLSQLIDTSNFYVALYDAESGMLSAPFEKDEKDQLETWPAKKSATGFVIEKKQPVLLKKQDVLRLIESGDINQTGTICEAWLGVPLLRDDKVIGAIVVQSYDNAGAFDDNSKEILGYVSSNISMAIERARIFEDLVQAKNRAEESETRFKALHNASFGGIAIHDQGLILDCNQGLSEMTGYSIEDLIGMNGLLLIAENSRGKVMQKILSGYEKPYEAIGRRKNGEEFPIRIEAKNIPYKGKLVRVTEFRDITADKKNEKELKAALEKAQESDRLKSAFLANMSHEIRTPMNGILGFAELLKEPRLSDEQQNKYIDIIEKSGERMLNIINDIVDISRIEAGLMDLTLKESNINEQLDYIYTFFKPQVEAKGMHLKPPGLLPAEEAIIVTDCEKLFAILTNLVKNAIKYSNEGTIEFGCNIPVTHGRASLRFFIKDTGIGIPKNRQHAIFDRFVQADIEDADARQGAGLGLAISKAYVEMLGGKIWVESEEGKGSTFYFTIQNKK